MGGATTFENPAARAASGSTWIGFVSPTARAYSRIFSRPTSYSWGGYSLPTMAAILVVCPMTLAISGQMSWDRPHYGLKTPCVAKMRSSESPRTPFAPASSTLTLKAWTTVWRDSCTSPGTSVFAVVFAEQVDPTAGSAVDVQSIGTLKSYSVAVAGRPP